jgi:hypothetical protein
LRGQWKIMWASSSLGAPHSWQPESKVVRWWAWRVARRVGSFLMRRRHQQFLTLWGILSCQNFCHWARDSRDPGEGERGIAGAGRSYLVEAAVCIQWRRKKPGLAWWVRVGGRGVVLAFDRLPAVPVRDLETTHPPKKQGSPTPGMARQSPPDHMDASLVKPPQQLCLEQGSVSGSGRLLPSFFFFLYDDHLLQ